MAQAVATFSQVGAQFGFAAAWTMLLTYPLIAVVQEINARVDRTTGLGIAGNMRKHDPAWLLRTLVLPLGLASAHGHAAATEGPREWNASGRQAILQGATADPRQRGIGLAMSTPRRSPISSKPAVHATRSAAQHRQRENWLPTSPH
jgi:hypothetical protein